MMSQPQADCAAVRDLLEVHALRALTSEESDLIESHVLTCRTCDDRLREFTDILPLLGMAAAPLAPSTSVRESLLAMVGAEKHLPVEPMPVAQPRARSMPMIWQRMRFSYVFSVPTIGLLLLLGGLALGSQYQLGNQRDRVAVLEQQNEGLSTHLESIRLGKATYGSDVGVYAFQRSVEDSTPAGLLLTGPDRRQVLISLWSFTPSNAPLHVVFGSAEHGDVVLGTILVDSSGVGSVQVMLPDTIDSFRHGPNRAGQRGSR